MLWLRLWEIYLWWNITPSLRVKFISVQGGKLAPRTTGLYKRDLQNVYKERWDVCFWYIVFNSLVSIIINISYLSLFYTIEVAGIFS